jgi:hyperosmotically inducible periplasmic protein
MRLIRRLLLLAIVGAGGVAAYNYWSDTGWPGRPRAVALEAKTATQQATRLANRAAHKAGEAASKVGDTMSQGALTAKIKSKMALDDHVKAQAINVDTSGSVVTLTGVVASADERTRAVGLARDTEGVSQVVDRLQVRKP